MGFGEHLVARTFPVLLEITPPQRSRPELLLRRAGLLGARAAAIDLIQRPGRQPSLEAARDLAEAGLTPIWHLVTDGRQGPEIARELRAAAETGLSNLLVLKGDHGAAEAGLSIREAIARARDTLPGACIGATLNQFARDPAVALRNLFPKLAAGATYVETQPVFALEALRPFAEAIKARFPAVAVIAMAMPLPSAEAGAKLAARLGIPAPAGPPFEELLLELASSQLVDGLALMTFEMDPGPDVAARILSALRTPEVVARAGGRD